jgi:hypothetical protein
MVHIGKSKEKPTSQVPEKYELEVEPGEFSIIFNCSLQERGGLQGIEKCEPERRIVVANDEVEAFKIAQANPLSCKHGRMIPQKRPDAAYGKSDQDIYLLILK